MNQFRSGKNCYMKDQDIEGRVAVTSVEKTMCLFKDDGTHKYSKGIIQGCDVIPFHFLNGVLAQ